MRNSIGGAWLLTIVITFMAIFIAYIAVTFNYKIAFEMRSKMLEIIEKNNGFNQKAVNSIDTMLKGYKYSKKAKCPKKSYGIEYIGVTDNVPTTDSNKKENYCVYREVRSEQGGSETKFYYEVYVFFGFSLPIFGDIFTFRVNGETNAMYYPEDLFQTMSGYVSSTITGNLNLQIGNGVKAIHYSTDGGLTWEETTQDKILTLPVGKTVKCYIEPLPGYIATSYSEENPKIFNITSDNSVFYVSASLVWSYMFEYSNVYSVRNCQDLECSIRELCDAVGCDI